jgi:16S rRNA (guanine527-N7)-methyltransferase
LIAALADRYGLTEPAAGQLETLLEYVAEQPSAPTAVRDRGAIVRDHLADSLVGLELPVIRTAATLADLGSGAGFPGLPLAIALDHSAVRLIESNGRKCRFIAGAIAACELLNAEVANARAEEWRDGLQRCDVVVARALAPLAVVAEYAAPLLRLEGTLVVWRGRRDPADESAARRAAGELGLELCDPIPVTPYAGAANRHLQPLVKVAPTPDRFPRRPGVARKRPLGGAAAQPDSL